MYIYTYIYIYIYIYRCRINQHSSRRRLYFGRSGKVPLISKLTQGYPAAANKSECVFIRPVALTFAMSVNIDIRGEGVRPTPATSRMSVYLSDTGSVIITTMIVTIVTITTTTTTATTTTTTTAMLLLLPLLLLLLPLSLLP